MKKLLIGLTLLSPFTFIQGENTPKQEILQLKLEQVKQLDQQIQTLTQKRDQLKAEANAKIEEGADSVLARKARREDRSAEQLLEQVQILNEQIGELQIQKQQLLMDIE